jgi:hypothetical protein
LPLEGRFTGEDPSRSGRVDKSPVILRPQPKDLSDFNHPEAAAKDLSFPRTPLRDPSHSFRVDKEINHPEAAAGGSLIPSHPTERPFTFVQGGEGKGGQPGGETLRRRSGWRKKLTILRPQPKDLSYLRPSLRDPSTSLRVDSQGGETLRLRSGWGRGRVEKGKGGERGGAGKGKGRKDARERGEGKKASTGRADYSPRSAASIIASQL